MAFTVAVTRNVPDKFRGFLASVMLEVAPTVYVAPHMTRAVRERVWSVLSDWGDSLGDDAGVLVVAPVKGHPSGLALMVLGFPKTEIFEADGFWLSRRDLLPLDD